MKRTILTILLGIIALISILLISYLTLLRQLIKIELVGEKNITLEVYNEYKEQGAKVTGTNKNYTIDGKVDNTKIGTYTITYKVKKIVTKTITRKITVVDTTAPVITLTGGDVTLYVNDTYQEPGFTAIDNYDKDITTNVEVLNTIDTSKAGEYKISYTSTDTSQNKTTVERTVIVKEKPKATTISGLTYINGILLVNKKYSLPSTYNPGVNATAYAALKKLQQGASAIGHSIPLISGFRSYSRQNTIYNNYVARDGQTLADTYSARPGHSEHQSGLAFDVGAIDDNYGNTPAGQWLAQNCHKYGFIIRYLEGKTNITGYKYEPWHIRYVGVDHATKIYNSNLTLEEYLGVA